jgi:hypothetical protein
VALHCAWWLQEHLLCGFDFVVAPVVQPGYDQPALQLQEGVPIEARIRKELMLASASWGGQVIASSQLLMSTCRLLISVHQPNGRNSKQCWLTAQFPADGGGADRGRGCTSQAYPHKQPSPG